MGSLNIFQHRISAFGFLIIILFFCNSAIAGIAGIWASDCDNDKSTLMLDLNAKNQYELTECEGFTCAPLPGFKNPIDIHNDKRIKFIGKDKMRINNKLTNQCHEFSPSKTDAELKKEAEIKSQAAIKKAAEIRKAIIGRWILDSEFNNERGKYPTREYLFFTRTGLLNPKKDKEEDRYNIVGNKLTLTPGKEDKEQEVYTVASISEKEVKLVVIVTQRKHELYLYKRDDLIIDNKWVSGKMLARINEKRWVPLEKKLFKLKRSQDYEMNTCDFYLFDDKNYYSHMRTQACYRKKNDSLINFDLNNKELPLYVDFGKWSVEDNNIIPDGVRTHNGRDTKQLWTEDNIPIQTKARFPGTLPGYKAIDMERIPQYQSIHDEARRRYQSRPN